jgi:hypothetical protein
VLVILAGSLGALIGIRRGAQENTLYPAPATNTTEIETHRRATLTADVDTPERQVTQHPVDGSHDAHSAHSLTSDRAENQAGARLILLILDTGGVPVAGATVCFFSAERSWPMVRRLTANSNGQVDLAGAGEFSVLWASTDDYCSRSYRLAELPTETREQDAVTVVTLDQPARYIVVDAQGASTPSVSWSIRTVVTPQSGADRDWARNELVELLDWELDWLRLNLAPGRAYRIGPLPSSDIALMLFQGGEICTRLIEVRPVTAEETRVAMDLLGSSREVELNCAIIGHSGSYRFMIKAPCDAINSNGNKSHLILAASSIEVGQSEDTAVNAIAHVPESGLYVIEVFEPHRRAFHCTVMLTPGQEVVLRDVVGGKVEMSGVLVDDVTPLEFKITIANERTPISLILNASQGLRYFAPYDGSGRAVELYCFDKLGNLVAMQWVVDLHAIAAFDAVLLPHDVGTVEFTAELPSEAGNHPEQTSGSRIGRLVLPVAKLRGQ